MAESTGIVVGGCRIEREIGRGGAGTVYRATQLGIGRAVAVKLIPAGAEGAGTAGRFEREAHAAGALDHPHCLPVYAAGEQDGLLYLVMRLVNGPDLARLIAARGALSPEVAVALVEQVASAVDHAHRTGLIHRDLKPANILIEPDGGVGHAFVSDFGLMRSLTDPGITQSGQWVGTPRFAAPEQMHGGEVGPAADIYALGGVLSEALGPGAPAGLSAVITRALDPDPGARFPSAGALASAAHAALGAPSRPEPTRVTRAPKRTGRPRRTAALGLGLVICAAVAAIAVALVLALHRHGTAPSAERTGTRTTPATTTATPAGNELVTQAFSATLPSSWTTATASEQLDGYERTIVQNPTGTAEAFIDRSASAGQSLIAHAHGVENAASRTAGYRLVSFGTTTIDAASVVVWSFTLSGVPDGQRVDVFREVGGQLFAVLGSSNSLSVSEHAATGIAASIRLR